MSISRRATSVTTSGIRSGTWFMASLTAFSHASSKKSCDFARSAVTLRYASIAFENSRPSSNARAGASSVSADSPPPPPPPPWLGPSPRRYAWCSACSSPTRCGKNSRAIRVASFHRCASL